MLYDNRQLGRLAIGASFAVRLKAAFSGKHYADLDLLSMNPHLQRDLGLGDGEIYVQGRVDHLLRHK